MTTSKRKKALIKLLARQKVAGLVGKVLSYNEQKLNTLNDIDTCGYIRNPLFLEDKYYGNCALNDFKMCTYPCSLPRLGNGKYKDFKCPVYKHFIKKQK